MFVRIPTAKFHRNLHYMKRKYHFVWSRKTLVSSSIFIVHLTHPKHSLKKILFSLINIKPALIKFRISLKMDESVSSMYATPQENVFFTMHCWEKVKVIERQTCPQYSSRVCQTNVHPYRTRSNFGKMGGEWGGGRMWHAHLCMRSNHWVHYTLARSQDAKGALLHHASAVDTSLSPLFCWPYQLKASLMSTPG